jgi:hypothetical protein
MMRSFNMRLQGVLVFSSPTLLTAWVERWICVKGELGEFSFCFLLLQVPASGNEYNEMGLRDTGVLCYFS